MEKQGKKVVTNKPILVCLLILMCVLPIVSSDIYFSILPEISHYFHATPLEVKNSLTLFLLGFSLGQLFYGVLSDRCGRKKMLLIGLIIYFLATIACVIAPTIYLLNYARFFQGFGGCSGAIMGRAIIADSFDLKASAHIYTILGPFIGLSPAIAPTLGAVISIYWHWQFVFVFLACVSFLLFMLIVFLFEETHNERNNISFSNYFLDCFNLIYNKKYLCYSSFACGAYIAWFAFIVESSFLYSSYDLNILQRSFLYVPLAIPYLIGNLFAKKLIKKNLDFSQVLRQGLIFYTLGLCIIMLYALIVTKLVLIMIGMFFIVAANGYLIPLGTAGALSSIEVNKGAATAALGCVQLALASLGTYIVSSFQQNTSQIQLAVLIMVCTVIMWWCFKINFLDEEQIGTLKTNAN